MTQATATTPTTSRRPPRWLWRALLMAVAATFLGIIAWNAFGQLGQVTTILVMSWFLSLAMEPPIRWLVKRGIRRTRSTGIVMATSLIGIGAVIALFGSLFVDQVVDFVQHLPEYYASLVEWVDSTFGTQLPSADEAVDTIASHWQDFAPTIIGAGASLIGGIFTFTSVLLVTYYMASTGPRFRAAVLRFLEPVRQREVLRLWEVSTEKIADFINSRLALAALCTVFTWIFLALIDIPYALPLAAFTGVVSQFVPTIGTYIGGALPVAVALTISPLKALVVLAFIILYQQVENYWFSPKISARALQINPAVSFVGVIGFGAVFGAIGAFLALPVIATVQAVASTYIRRHELVDDPLLHEDVVELRKHRGWVDLDETKRTSPDPGVAPIVTDEPEPAGGRGPDEPDTPDDAER